MKPELSSNKDQEPQKINFISKKIGIYTEKLYGELIRIDGDIANIMSLIKKNILKPIDKHKFRSTYDHSYQKKPLVVFANDLIGFKPLKKELNRVDTYAVDETIYTPIYTDSNPNVDRGPGIMSVKHAPKKNKRNVGIPQSRPNELINQIDANGASRYFKEDDKF